MKEELEKLEEEIDDFFTFGHMSEEAWDFLQNIQAKLYAISEGRSFDELPKLKDLEKY